MWCSSRIFRIENGNNGSDELRSLFMILIEITKVERLKSLVMVLKEKARE